MPVMPVTARSRRGPTPSPPPRRRSIFGYAWLAGFLLLAAWLGCPHCVALRGCRRFTCLCRPRPHPSPVTTRRMEDVQLGDRAMGRNPLREQVDESVPEPDPATWRKLGLHMIKQNGLSLWIELLRSQNWIEATGAKAGKTIHLELPEMGAVGDAEVTYLGPAPQQAG